MSADPEDYERLAHANAARWAALSPWARVRARLWTALAFVEMREWGLAWTALVK